MTAKLLIPNNKQLLASAWHLVEGSKWPFFLLFLVSLIWGTLVALIVNALHLDTWTRAHINDWGMIIIPLALAIGSSVFLLGATSMGIARAREQQDISLKTAFIPWRRLLKVIITLFCIMVINLLIADLVIGVFFAAAMLTKQTALVYIGIIVADLAMLVMICLFLLALPITVDTTHGPFKSMHLSMAYMRHYLWQCYLLMLLLYILMFLSVFTLFISYLWLVPLSFILFGQLYLRLIPEKI